MLGTYLLMDGATGAPLAAIDGTRLTLWRTAAASALAARYLAREDASRMVMVGAGALAPFLIRAHAGERPIRQVALWNHRPEKAEPLAAELSTAGLPVEPRPISRRGARSRHRLLRDALGGAAREGRMAEAGRASRPRRRLQPRHARGRRRGAAPRPPVYVDTPAARPRAAMWRSD